MEEREIDLRLLIYKTLKFWRKALVLGLVLAIILGGYSFVKQSSADSAEYSSSLESYETDKALLEAQLENLKTAVAYKREYIQDSTFMKIDPYNEYLTSVHVELSGNGQDSDLIKAAGDLYSFASGGEMFEKVFSKAGVTTESRYISELISTEVNYAAATLEISIIAPTASDATAIAQAVKEVMDSKANESGVKCTVSSGNVYTVVDSDLEISQNYVYSEIEATEKSIDNVDSQIKELVAPTKESLTAVIKKAVIGFVVGVIAVFGWYCVKFVITSKISGDDFWKAVKVSFLGSVYTEKKRKENAIDKFVRSLCGYGDDLPFAVSCSLVAANIGALQENSNGERLALVGDVDKNVVESFLAGTDVDFAGDILSQSSAVQSLGSYDGVILAVTEDVTGMDQIVHQMNLIKSWGKKVVGAVSIK